MIKRVKGAVFPMLRPEFSGKRRSHVFLPILSMVSIGGAPPPATPSRASASARIFSDQAMKLGAQKCSGLYSALGDLVSRGSQYSVRTEVNKNAPNSHVVQGAVGMAFDLPDLKGQAAGIIVAASVADGCEGHFVRIAPFQKPCPQILRYLPADSALVSDLSQVPLYQLGGNQGQALLISSGTGCVVVTITEGSQRL